MEASGIEPESGTARSRPSTCISSILRLSQDEANPLRLKTRFACFLSPTFAGHFRLRTIQVICAQQPYLESGSRTEAGRNARYGSRSEACALVVVVIGNYLV